MSDVPTSLDELVADSRRLLEKVRADYGNPADFDHHIGVVIEEALKGFDAKTRALTLRAIGLGDDYHA